jgi:hypothetical protein
MLLRRSSPEFSGTAGLEGSSNPRDGANYNGKEVVLETPPDFGSKRHQREATSRWLLKNPKRKPLAVPNCRASSRECGCRGNDLGSSLCTRTVLPSADTTGPTNHPPLA